jgi:ADP-dependent NAD(P)H-hydrate dehydratase / NAD(P)H-hydrate epimerase
MSVSPSKLNALELAQRLKRAPAEHKGDADKVVLIGGAPGMAGALLLAGNACLYLGAGWTILEMLDPVSAHACIEHPELMVRLADPQIDLSNQSNPAQMRSLLNTLL